jgi:hypothetical protein
VDLRDRKDVGESKQWDPEGWLELCLPVKSTEKRVRLDQVQPQLHFGSEHSPHPSGDSVDERLGEDEFRTPAFSCGT